MRSRAGAEKGHRSPVPESLLMPPGILQNTEFNPSWEVSLVDVDETVEEENPGRTANFPFQGSIPPALCRPPAIQIAVLRIDGLPMHAAHLVWNHVPFIQGPLGRPFVDGIPADRTRREDARLERKVPTQQPCCPIAVPRSHLKSRTEMSMAQDRTRTGSPSAYPIDMPPTTRRSAHL